MNWFRWLAVPVVAVLASGSVMLPARADGAALATQWNLGATAFGIDAASAWQTATGAGTVVAVIDTGISPHPDLSGSTTDLIGGNALPGYDFIASTRISGDSDGWDANPTDEMTKADAQGTSVPNWHGLHVAGIVAALRNDIGVTGVAPEAKVVPIRLVGLNGEVDTDNMDEAIRWGAGEEVPGAPTNLSPATVLNLSIAVKGACPEPVQSAIDAARGRGTAVVVAAGNTWDASQTGHRDLLNDYFPGNCAGVIPVTASNSNGQLTDYSNIGDAQRPAAIAAPGDVISTCNAADPYCITGYAWAGGTSMSAPHVAGVIALLRSAQPYLQVDQLTTAITASATPFASTCAAEECGSGILNARAALAYAAQNFLPPTASSSPSPTTDPTQTPDPTPTQSPTPSESPTPSPTPSDLPSPSQSAVATPSPMPSQTPTASSTASSSPSPSRTATPSPSPRPSPSPTVNPPPRPVAITLRTPPKVSGTYRVGHTVRASQGSWNPTPAGFHYQWYRNNKRIAKATKASYKLTRADRNKRIRVRVTVDRAGCSSTVAYSSSHRVR